MASKKRADLLARIDQLQVPEGQLALWALGQSGFVIKGGRTIAYIDPYLSDSISASGGPQRRFPIPLDPAAATHAQVVFATHEHMDHADGPTLGPLLAASAQATLVTSREGRAIAIDADISADRIVVPRLGERTEVAGLAYTAIPASHGLHAGPKPTYASEVDAEGHARWMGFLIECNGVTLYHSGDTVVIPEILDALGGHRIDLALLPINGRDFFRERDDLVGNLWPREAAQLAVAIGAEVLIGIHNDLFAENRVRPGMLYDDLNHFAPFQRCHTLQPGELYLYAG
jgi:L-ascorbate metabolism protein UlaG (beta-lactamase superfamily)